MMPAFKMDDTYGMLTSWIAKTKGDAVMPEPPSSWSLSEGISRVMNITHAM